MRKPATVVLDVGKTLSKIGLWSEDGALIDRRTRPNDRIDTGQYTALDVHGIESFLRATLSDFARIAEVTSIIPVAHGAAAAVVSGKGLMQAPLDYEHPIPARLRALYDERRESFADTGSPALPDGLNLGAQLYYLQSLNSDLLSGDSCIVPWAQYWSWLLSGVAASELTTLACHTDLWRPFAGTPSRLASHFGWAERLAPLRNAAAVLGPIKPGWASRTGLSPEVRIHCGLHDSNAALIAARGFPEIADQEATILSTGTWFVAMRTPGPTVTFDIRELDETRDCLVNVDARGRPIPSSRFMGGREIELLTGGDTHRVDASTGQHRLLSAVDSVLARGSMVLPTLVPGSGPYGKGPGRWIAKPTDEDARRVVVCLYAALVADASLDLVGARDRLLIEGRFALSEVFVRALAMLRPDSAVYAGHVHSDVSYGALRLLNPSLPPPGAATRVIPLPNDLREYRRQWRAECSVL
jgi:sugar (pentulose or hexulose) kinase